MNKIRVELSPREQLAFRLGLIVCILRSGFNRLETRLSRPGCLCGKRAIAILMNDREADQVVVRGTIGGF